METKNNLAVTTKKEGAVTIATMAFDIGRIHPFTIRKTFSIFYNSLAKFNPHFRIFLYTNLPPNWFSRPGVEVFTEEEKNFGNYYKGSRWLNMSMHKFFIMEKHLYRGENPIWLDLDTIVGGNLEFLNNYSNFFITYGFGENLVQVNSKIALPQKFWVHGHANKIDKDIAVLVRQVLEKEKDDFPQYDIMSVYTLLKERYPEKFTILNNLTDKLINLDWCYDKDSKPWKVNSLTNEHHHPEPKFIKNRIKMVDNKLVDQNGRQFLFITFTFLTLEMNLRRNWKDIIDPAARQWLRSLCHISLLDRLILYAIFFQSIFQKDKLKKIPGIKKNQKVTL